MNIETKFKTDLKFKKEVIKTVAKKLGCVVEMIDLRLGTIRMRKEGNMILVSFWRGISFENAVKQMKFFVANA